MLQQMNRLKGLPGVVSWSIVGLLLGHQLAYALVFRDPHILAHALADTGHNWLALMPIIGAVALAIAFTHAANQRDDKNHLRQRAIALISIQLIAYVALESIERLAHGALPSDLLAELTSTQGALLFVVGLLLQLGTALGAVLLARGISIAVRCLLRGERPKPRLGPARVPPTRSFKPNGVALQLRPARGPPLLA